MTRLRLLMKNRPRTHFQEWVARALALLLAVGIPLSALILAQIGMFAKGETVVIHARMPEKGGWSLDNLSMTAGQPLRLKLTSDDVVHSFKIGQSDERAIELLPGKTVETTLTFDQPGKYTFYCTRWCGPNHWRMRGVIEVLPKPGQQVSEIHPEPPLYVTLGLDIDAPHLAESIPETRPSAAQGASLNIELPQVYLSISFYRTHSPAQAWEILRLDSITENLNDQQVWDLVAFIWSRNMDSQDLETGRTLYAENCAACHGEGGAGDGVYAESTASGSADDRTAQDLERQTLKPPADFTDPVSMLGASPAVLQGKIVRGGMGTGMPYWGPVFTEDQIWDLVDTLYTFQFNMEVDP